jgi:hypothetical protein
VPVLEVVDVTGERGVEAWILLGLGVLTELPNDVEVVGGAFFERLLLLLTLPLPLPDECPVPPPVNLPSLPLMT